MYKVLIVDDEPFIPEGLRKFIPWEEYGLEIAGTAGNGLEALELWVALQPRIVITDIRMPEMNGLELIRRLKEREPQPRLIVLSGYDDFEYVKESLKLGIENYLLKPVNREELVETLANTVAKLETAGFGASVRPQDIRIIRDNIFYRWVTGAIQPEELQERAALLEIQLNLRHYCVAMIRLLSNPGEPFVEVSEALETICREILDREGLGQVFINPDGKVILLFTEQKASLEKTVIQAALENCIQQFLSVYPAQTFITCGSLVSGYTAVPQSYRQALELQEYRLFLPSNQLLDFDVREQSPVKVKITEFIDFQTLQKLFAANDSEGVVCFIDAVFDHMRHTPGLTPAFIRHLTADMLIALRSAVKITAPIGRNNFDSPEITALDLFQFQDLEELAARFKTLARSFFAGMDQAAANLSPLVKRAILYIQANYRAELSLKTLAAQFKVNANYLGQLFKTETGEYFSDYINRFRINQAQEILADTAYKSADIASLVGYPNPNYFYNIFRKYTGVSPTEYRNRLMGS